MPRIDVSEDKDISHVRVKNWTFVKESALRLVSFITSWYEAALVKKF